LVEAYLIQNQRLVFIFIFNQNSGFLQIVTVFEVIHPSPLYPVLKFDSQWKIPEAPFHQSIPEAP
jgi:hypothetical protein